MILLTDEARFEIVSAAYDDWLQRGGPDDERINEQEIVCLAQARKMAEWLESHGSVHFVTNDDYHYMMSWADWQSLREELGL